MSEDGCLYDVFISYSRRDKLFALKLQKALDSYRPPRGLDVAARGLRVFRDETDFTGVDYQKSVKTHLESSRKLILLCSPDARASRYVDEEVRTFGEAKGAENILPVLVSGIPNNEAGAEGEDRKAFPEALCELMEMPLATSYLGFDPERDKPDGREFDGSWFTLLANLYGLSRAEVEQRERRRRIRRRRITTAIVGSIFAVLVTALVITILSRQEAVRQRTLAEERQQAALARQLGVQAQAVLAGRDQAGLTLGDKAKLAAQLAIESVVRHPTLEGDVALREALESLPRRVSHTPFELRHPTLSLDGAYLLGLGRNRAPTLVDTSAGRELIRLEIEAAGALAFSPDAGHFAVGLPDGVAVYRTGGESGAEQVSLLIPESAASGRATHAVALGPGGRFLAVSQSGVLEVWEVPSAERLATIESLGHRLTISPDGKYLAAVTLELGHERKAGSFTIWEGWNTAAPREALSGEGWRVVFSPDSRYLVASDSEGGASVWSTARFSARREVPAPEILDTTVFGVPVYDQLAISPDGRKLATYRGGTLVVWEGWRERPRRAARVPGVALEGGDEIAFGPGGRTIVTAAKGSLTGGSLDVWRVADEFEAVVIDGGTEVLEKLRFSPEGDRVATLAAEGVARVWDAATGAPLGRPQEAVRDLSISPDGRYLALAGKDCVRLLEGWATESPGEVDCLTPEGGGEIVSAHFGAGGRYLASVTRAPQAAHVWEVESRREVMTSEGASAMTLSRMSAAFALRTAKGLESGRLFGETEQINEQILGFETLSDDGRYLAERAILGEVVEVHELGAGRLPGSLIQEAKGAGGLVFSSDGTHLAVEGAESVQVWNVEAGREVARVSHRGGEGAFDFSPDGRYLASASDDGVARVWRWRPEDLAAAACHALDGESLTEPVWIRYLGAEPYRQLCAQR